MEPVEVEKAVSVVDLLLTVGPVVVGLLLGWLRSKGKAARATAALDAALKAWNAHSNGEAVKAVDAHVKNPATARLLRDGLAKCKPPANGTGHG